MNPSISMKDLDEEEIAVLQFAGNIQSEFKAITNINGSYANGSDTNLKYISSENAPTELLKGVYKQIESSKKSNTQHNQMPIQEVINTPCPPNTYIPIPDSNVKQPETSSQLDENQMMFDFGDKARIDNIEKNTDIIYNKLKKIEDKIDKILKNFKE